MDGEQITSSEELKITDNMISSMRSTKPWVRFLAIVGFIGIAFMVILGLLMLIFGGTLFPNKGNPYYSIIMGIFYLISSILYLMPVIYIFKYSSAIGRFLNNKKAFEMESALSCQKSFWKFAGMLCLIMFIIAIIGIIAAIAIPQFNTYRMRGYCAGAKSDLKNTYVAAVACLEKNPQKIISDINDLNQCGFQKTNKDNIISVDNFSNSSGSITSTHPQCNKTYFIDSKGDIKESSK
jgi:Tfp pilus assembly major pilin PilA